ncbi:hypothetical protein IC235_02120 [Hymenobacter sp. BT664]|uniref:Lipoprotein n=1 Tax=Hymenobacter montanus TaxID=2771359 RepID=A0A927B9M7_9BACT|nr:hypothetical protein [Hymenobacter montanus]MBD2766685.1 hypothetical protein [Hymenobacter montanus]
MSLFRTLSGAALVCLAGASVSSCLNAPDYPIEPQIDFKEVQVTRVPASGGNLAVTTLKFVLNFRDGDGDLGLSPDDIEVAPWNARTGGPNNRGYGLNYFIQPFLKDPVTGQFVRFVIDSPGEYDSRYPRLDGADAKPAPLKGELRYELPLSIDRTFLRSGQVFRFEISIMDRALHQSNTITTSEVTL